LSSGIKAGPRQLFAQTPRDSPNPPAPLPVRGKEGTGHPTVDPAGGPPSRAREGVGVRNASTPHSGWLPGCKILPSTQKPDPGSQADDLFHIFVKLLTVQ